MTSVQYKMRSSLALLSVLMTSSVCGMTQMGVEQIRNSVAQGQHSLDLIMNMVMISLPDSLQGKLRSDLAKLGVTNSGFQNASQVPVGPSGTFGRQPLASGGGGSASTGSVPGSAAKKDDTASDTGGLLTDFNSDDPIVIGRRKRAAFGNNFGNNIFSNNNNLNPSGFGGGNFGGSNHFGIPSGNPGVPGTGFNPADINGNLYGGNSAGFIQYPGDLVPGTGTGSGGHFHGSSSNNFFHGSFGNSFGRRNECPRQVDQAFIYQYSGDPTFYPAIDITNELFARSLPGSDLLFQCLSRQFIYPNEPPQLFLDPFLLFSNTTCRFLELQAWSYESTTFTGRCWPLVGFQESPFYKTCLNRFCKCEPKHNFFGDQQNLCITEYRTVSLWSYCERLLPNRRIVRDRILLPDACTCTTVDCQPVQQNNPFNNNRNRNNLPF